MKIAGAKKDSKRERKANLGTLSVLCVCRFLSASIVPILFVYNGAELKGIVVYFVSF